MIQPQNQRFANSGVVKVLATSLLLALVLLIEGCSSGPAPAAAPPPGAPDKMMPPAKARDKAQTPGQQ